MPVFPGCQILANHPQGNIILSLLPAMRPRLLAGAGISSLPMGGMDKTTLYKKMALYKKAIKK
jgi:hypothetical protein